MVLQVIALLSLAGTPFLLHPSLHSRSDQISSHDVSPAPQTTLKVFVLAGQSNTVGMADVNVTNKTTGGPKNGTLVYQLSDPRTAQEFSPLWNSDAKNWTIFEDIAMWYNEVGQLGKDGTMVNGSKIPGINGVDACFGPLSVGYGAGCGANQRGKIGPELGFGYGMAQGLAPGEKFLIMKNAWGGKTIAFDFRPPTSASSADPYCTDQNAGSPCKTVGHYYQVMMANVKKMMAPGAIGKMFPELSSMKPEIAGFGWWQGWNDGCDLNMTAAYETNLVNLIGDLRKEWGNPTLPVSVATAGFVSPEQSDAEEASRSPKSPTPWIDDSISNKLETSCAGDRGCRRLDVILSQLAATNATRHPELGGHAITVDQRPFHRPPQFSPDPAQGYHYFHNSETYFLTGVAMAKGMLQVSGP